MVFIVALAQTHPHTPGRQHSFQWNSQLVSINWIWLILNLSGTLTETWLHFFSFFYSTVFPALLVGEIKEKETVRDTKVM